MVPSSQLLSRCTAPKNTAIPNLPHPSNNSCFSAQLSLQVPTPEQNPPGICRQGGTFPCPQGRDTARLSPGADGKVPPHPSGLELCNRTPPCTCFGKSRGENIPSRAFCAATWICDVSPNKTDKKIPLTKSIPALQVSSKHFLSVNPNLSRFQLLFVGLLHLCKGYQDHQKSWLSLEVLAPTGAQTAAPGGGLNPGKLGYGKGQSGWSKITPPTSQQYLCCSKCSLHHHKLLLLLSKYYTLVLCASKILL